MTEYEKKHRLKREWTIMIGRCHGNYKDTSYKENGIVVCDEWRNSFESFEKWAVENGYSHELIIDRINTFGNYEPSNCRWITKAENSRNRKDTVFVIYKGEIKKLCELCSEKEMKYSTVYQRLRNGWNIERALSEPIRYVTPTNRGMQESRKLRTRNHLKCSIPYKKAMGYE